MRSTLVTLSLRYATVCERIGPAQYQRARRRRATRDEPLRRPGWHRQAAMEQESATKQSPRRSDAQTDLIHVLTEQSTLTVRKTTQTRLQLFVFQADGVCFDVALLFGVLPEHHQRRLRIPVQEAHLHHLQLRQSGTRELEKRCKAKAEWTKSAHRKS